jgi:hypothetical protein
MGWIDRRQFPTLGLDVPKRPTKIDGLLNIEFGEQLGSGICAPQREIQVVDAQNGAIAE